MSDVLAGTGVLLAAAAAAAAILLPPGRARAAAMAAAIVLFPVLILGDQWHTAQIEDLRDDGGRIAALGALAIAAVAALGYFFHRWPLLLPLAIVFAIPFRVPLHAGGDTANLLVPLYLVIAGGVAAIVARDWSVAAPLRDRPDGAALWLRRVLAAVVALYALQTLYSEDFSKGLQNVCFFIVPFSVAYGLISDVRWDRRLLRMVLVLVAVEATAFVAIGSVEYLTRDLFWNDQVIRSNEFHTYFRVNSVFWDPNIYGRYLALVMVLATAALLWARERRDFALLALLLGVLWLGLVQTFSQSSYVALLGGLAVLAAIRWSWRWTLAAVLVVVALGSTGFDFGSLNKDTSGRANLISGGIEMFADRPLWGYGAGSFEAAYRDHRENRDAPVSASHTEPIGVAAEQGLIGFASYAALLVVALWVLGAGMWRGPPDGAATARWVGRAAILAAFAALLVHTMAYAGFYEDPITWLLLAAGASLAAAPATGAAPAPAPPPPPPAAIRSPA